MREIRLLTETSTQIRVSVDPKAPPQPNQRGANDNYKELCFLASVSCTETSEGSQNGARLSRMYAHGRRFFSATMKEMTGSAGTSGTGSAPKVTPGFDLGSVNVVDLSPKPQENKELEGTALRPGTAAKRLLAEDQAHEIFGYLPETYSLWHRLRYHGWSTLRYLMQTEVHTYAFSVAANSILSFFPFIVLLLTLVHRVLHSAAMYDVVLQLLRDYLPSNKDFVIRNLQFLASVRGRGQVLSFVMLLITSTGIFLPLEVALNSIWGFKKNRSYLMNLIVSLGLTLACGCLAVLSIALTAQNLRLLERFTGAENFVFQGLGFVVMKASAIVATIAIYFLIYWLLPNGKVPVRAVLPAAIITGVVSEGAKYLYIIVLPWLNFQEVYGPFSVTVTLIFWSFCSGMLLLGGAYLSAAEHSIRKQARRATEANS
jgi:membrane protein